MTKEDDKKSIVSGMFDSIAHRYDFLNHLLSFGIDRLWRKKAINTIRHNCSPSIILDVATGTGDLAIAAMKLNPDRITGIDISEKMLEIGRKKVQRLGLSDKIELKAGDSENIMSASEVYDVTMVAFGVRNFADPISGLREMFRVLKYDGMIMVLEFSKPTAFPFRQLYSFYFFNILPVIGRIFSKDEKAYTYLPESVKNFPDNNDFLKLLSDAGFKETNQKKLAAGVASIYTGKKLRQAI